jgi:hypothetical protein
MEWMIRHKTTPRTEALVNKLIALARDINRTVLAVASKEARAEWLTLCNTWPTAAELRSGRVCFSDEELERMAGKVIQFKTILVEQPRPRLALVKAA